MTRKTKENQGRAGATDETDEWVEGFDFDLDLDFDFDLPAWSVEGFDLEWDTWDTCGGDCKTMGNNGGGVEVN